MAVKMIINLGCSLGYLCAKVERYIKVLLISLGSKLRSFVQSEKHAPSKISAMFLRSSLLESSGPAISGLEAVNFIIIELVMKTTLFVNKFYN